MYRLIFLLFLISCGQSTINDDGGKKVISKRPLDGKAIFQANCASCHHPMKDLTGPALRDALVAHSTSWLHDFFTNRNSLKDDSIYNRIIENDEKINCIEFPNITIEELQDYVVGCNDGCTF